MGRGDHAAKRLYMSEHSFVIRRHKGSTQREFKIYDDIVEDPAMDLEGQVISFDIFIHQFKLYFCDRLSK